MHLQTFNATRLKIPGYQGFVPGKDNHVYGRTFGDGAKLALEACGLMKQGQDPSHMEKLVDYRPQVFRTSHFVVHNTKL